MAKRFTTVLIVTWCLSTTAAAAQPSTMSEADLQILANMSFAMGFAAGTGMMSEPQNQTRFCDNLFTALRTADVKAQSDLDGRHDRARDNVVSEMALLADAVIENSLGYVGCIADAAQRGRR